MAKPDSDRDVDYGSLFTFDKFTDKFQTYTSLRPNFVDDGLFNTIQFNVIATSKLAKKHNIRYCEDESEYLNINPRPKWMIVKFLKKHRILETPSIFMKKFWIFVASGSDRAERLEAFINDMWEVERTNIARHFEMECSDALKYLSHEEMLSIAVNGNQPKGVK